MDNNAQAAIQAALVGDWKNAIKLNLHLLKSDPHDPDSLNRLGRAYFETGQKSKAEATYKKVLRLDKFNSIATKNLGLLKLSRMTHSSSPKKKFPLPPTTPEFLEEPGITRTVSLIRPGDPKIINRLHPGSAVSIVPRNHCVSIISQSNEYLGRLSDDLASRLLPLLRAGNKYHAWIRSTDGPKIFIKEVFRSPKFKHIPSFPPTEKLSYAAFTPPELVHTEKPDVSGTEDQEDTGSDAASLETEPEDRQPPDLDDR